MKLTTGILAMAVMVGGSAATKAVAQNPDAIDNARSAAKSLQQKQANNNTAPQSATVPAKAKPAPGAPAPAVKPAAIPSSQPVPAAKPDSAAKPVHVSAQRNQLRRVNVIPGADGVQIEISSTQSITPRLSKLSSPDRVLVELPETVIASSQSKIPVGSAGVKGVRIGMDGKTPPTTSVVIDLEKPLAYELTPGSAGKVILTLHSEGAAPSVAKNSSAPAVKASSPAPAAKSAAATAQPMAAAKSAAPPKVAAINMAAPKATAQTSKPDPKQLAKAAPTSKMGAPAIGPAMTPSATRNGSTTIAASTVKASPAVSGSAPATAKSATATKEPKPEEKKKWALTGKRDPFFSPVVQQNGSGCSTGKKCLEIGAINLRGVVKSDSGFIAVVTNSLNKAYFLRENDPVFNGYVVKITGDSVVFQETLQDKLGKSFTREVVKRIFTPAV
jgi:Tfp pilus assembly protein PilP